MGKSNSVDYPEYSTGSVYVNGDLKSTTSRNGSDVVSNYYMSDKEKKLYDYAQNSYAESLPNLNVFSQDTVNDLNKQVEAYKNQGINLINETYKPMISDLMSDIASRFGNLDNSAFMNNLNSIESKRADAISALGQDVLSQKNSLIDDEMQRRYNYLSLLEDVQNNLTGNILNYLSYSQNNAESANNYGKSLMNARNSSSHPNLANSLMSASTDTITSLLPLLL